MRKALLHEDVAWRDRELERLMYDLEYTKEKDEFFLANRRLCNYLPRRIPKSGPIVKRVLVLARAMDRRANRLMVLKMKSVLPTVLAPLPDLGLWRRATRLLSAIGAVLLLSFDKLGSKVIAWNMWMVLWKYHIWRMLKRPE